MWFTSIQAGNTACNYTADYHHVLLHKLIKIKDLLRQNSLLLRHKTFVARNRFPHVKVACKTKKVGQAWVRLRKI